MSDRHDRDPLMREVGDALREPTEELSEEFYAEARRRFEAEDLQHPPHGFRILSWEAAGLAAAAVLAIALFAPWVAEQGTGPVPTITMTADSDDVARLDEVEGLAAEPVAPVAPAETANVAEEREATAGRFAPSPPEAGAPSSPQPKPQPRGERMKKAEQPNAAAGGTVGEAQPLSRSRRDVGAMADRAAAPQVMAKARDIAVPVSARTAGGRAIEIIDDQTAWRALLAGPDGRSLAALGQPASARRLVLISASTKARCPSVQVRLEADGYLLSFEPTGDGRTGCALTLPVDSNPVRLAPRP